MIFGPYAQMRIYKESLYNSLWMHLVFLSQFYISE